jgi:membrane protease YdiL (CAAX protease family)
MPSAELSQILQFLILELGIPLGLVLLFHFKIGKYPTPLPVSEDRKKEILETLVIWAIPVIFLNIIIFSSFAERLAASTPGALGLFVLMTMVPYIAIPVSYLVFIKKWTAKDFGFSKPREPAVIIAGVALFAFFGTFPLSNSTFTPIPVMMLLFALYQPAFIEEFFFRGIIQGKLERALGQNKAWFYSGILFGLAHFTTNFFVTGLDLVSGIFMLAGQIIAGWIFGIIYMKTRSLLPGMVCHYLTDGRLASIISMMFG